MIDPLEIEVLKLSELELLSDIADDDLLLVTHNNESFKVTKAQLLANATIKTFTHEQTTPAEVWTINHNLNCFPSVVCFDATDTLCYPDIDYIDLNKLRVLFANATAGKAYTK